MLVYTQKKLWCRPTRYFRNTSLGYIRYALGNFQQPNDNLSIVAAIPLINAVQHRWLAQYSADLGQPTHNATKDVRLGWQTGRSSKQSSINLLYLYSTLRHTLVEHMFCQCYQTLKGILYNSKMNGKDSLKIHI